ncbi:phage tail tape measure protein [Aeromonas salmonicida]|uniref:phage tail tape measure protein n=1 Tax=Aeromonas salmonicida TaxID=645 RepID=UPI00240DFBBA|nr:phage tail tape measure protein [Aeromonas salmonicida]WFC12727.1 phage tail tape measure protein [Aeromonas salmonicida]
MNPLKLQILLGAVDKITAPLKAASGQSRTTAQDLLATKKRIKELETQSGQIDGYRTLGRQIGATRAELVKAQREVVQLSLGMASVEQPTKAMTRAMEKAKQAAGALEQKEREMVSRYGRMKQGLTEAGINTKQLSDHQRRLKTDLAAANGQLDQQRAKLGQLADQQKRLNQVKANYRQTQELRGQIAGHGATAIAAGTAIGMPVYSAIKEYSGFEDAMKGVAKQVDGARTDSGELTSVYYDMAKEIKAISEEIPQLNGAIDIAALVEGAARMGVQGKDNLLNFARTAAKAATAFELPAGQLAEDMGKIANLYKIPIGNIEQLGDAINYLDDNAQSKGADIIDVLQRLGSVADKLDYRKAAAIGSTFLSLGAAPEIAASATNAMVRELGVATMQSKRFQTGIKAIGMKSADVEKAMTTDAMGTITKVLEKIKKLKAEDQLRVTTQIFGKEYGKDAAKLSNNLDELYRQLKLVNAEKSRGSMQRESDIDKDSLSSQWLILQAGITNVKANLGELLRGSLMDIIKYTKEIVVSIRHWVEENPELANTLVKVAAVTSIIAIAMGGLSLTIAALLGPLAIMKLIFGVLGVTFGGMLGAIGALLAPLAALAALGIAIIKFWQPISAFFSGLWQGIMTGLAPVFEAFKPFAPLIDGIGTGVKALSGWFGDLLEPLKFSKETLEGFGSAGQFVGRILGEAFNLALTPLKAFLKGIEWLLESMGILEAKKLPSFQMPAPTPSTPGYLNGNFGTPALAGGYDYGTTRRIREQVQPVALSQVADTTRTIREQLQPVALSPIADATRTVREKVINVNGNGAGRDGPRIVQTAKPVAARGASSTTEINAPINIVQQPGQSGADLAQEISRELDKRERQAAARGRATLGDRN